MRALELQMVLAVKGLLPSPSVPTHTGGERRRPGPCWSRGREGEGREGGDAVLNCSSSRCGACGAACAACVVRAFEAGACGCGVPFLWG